MSPLLPGAFRLFVLSFLIVLASVRPSSSQESSSSPAPAAPASGSTAPAPPAAQGSAAPAAPPPFVPPLPPAPSQTRLPAAFTVTTPLGSPTALFEFHPTFGFTEEYTDNFRLTQEGTNGQGSQSGRTSNFRSTLSAGFTLLINTPTTTGSLSSSLGVSKDSARDSTDTNFFPSFSGSVRHTFTPRLSLTISDSFTRSDEPSLADTTGLRRERRTFSSNALSIAVDWLLDLVSTQAYYRNSLFFSEEETMTHALGFSASTRLGDLNTLSGGYSLSLSDTSGSANEATTGSSRSSQSSESLGHTVFASLSRRVGYFGTAGVSSSFSTQSRGDSRIWNVSAFSSYGLPTGLALSGSLGYSRLSSDTGNDSNAVTANTSVSYRFAQAVVSLSAAQDFRQTFVDGQDFGIVLSRTFSARFSYPLTVYIGSSAFATYTETEPTSATRGVSERGNQGGGQTVRTFSAGLNLSWAILRWLSASLSYTFTERLGDATFGAAGGTNDGTTRENRAALSLSASF